MDASTYIFDTNKLTDLKLTKGTTGIGVNYTTGSGAFYANTPWYNSRGLGGASTSSIGTNPLKVTIGEGVKKIGNYTFYYANRVQLQSSISGITIGTNAFTYSGESIN